ncbi:nuclear transport factor 2 family protein [Spirosoma sp. 209]|uniref:nuclear transport factor 2 family protein n=1 Tax=Spirosoma sp. 209 TaxID=1955701 RepID=UPI00098D51DD|nr:nuclear transport factor 2 family protein [Spirosoma sp. 209]
MKAYGFVLLVALFASGCSSTDTVNIQDLNQQFIGAWNNKDTEKVIGFLAEDVHFLQGNTHFKGKSEVAQKWVRETMPTLADLKTNVVSSAADTQTAYEAGTYSVDVLPEGPQQPRGYGEGNFILLWKKGTDNTWKLNYAQLEGLPVQVKQ